MRGFVCATVIASLAFVAGCQSPTSADDSISYEDLIDVTPTPNPIVATTDADGRTYRVVRGNNQPDDILPYDWHTTFTVGISFNSNASDKDVDMDFPVKLTSTSLAVKQASGGIITTPTGSDTEHYEFVTTYASANQVTGVNSPITLAFEVWYDLPSLRKEAVIQLTLTFVEDDGGSFQRVVNLQVAP